MSDKESLKPFAEDARCPKCGLENVAAHFCPREQARWYAGCAIRREYDYIRRLCERCGYAWEELPLDASSEEKKEGINGGEVPAFPTDIRVQETSPAGSDDATV